MSTAEQQQPHGTPQASEAPSDALLGPADIRELAAALGVRPTKQKGQNFVIDANTVRRIVRTAEVRPDDVVVEVGPGLGAGAEPPRGSAPRGVAAREDHNTPPPPRPPPQGRGARP
ncbi:rRNA adenine N-6-methyltransferase family protein, partial [Streptomyces sp. NPDC058157]|uniref:rRNA adenine N-6-methyltransferase family protein n=1 Tax=Streptomyces sp. NPDC058157 TaxID=3346360 RepID=UPI0036E0600E